MTSRTRKWLETEAAPPQIILVTGAPGMGKTHEIAAVSRLSQESGAEVLLFDGRIEPIDVARLLAVLADRGWMEQAGVPAREAQWTAAAIKRLLIVDHVDQDRQTMTWLTSPRTRAALKPNVAVLLASRQRPGPEGGIEPIHLQALPPDHRDERSAGFPTLLYADHEDEFQTARGILADQLLADSTAVLEALSLVEQATLEGITAIMDHTIPRGDIASLKDCSWVRFRGRGLILESAAAAIIRQDFACNAPQRYAQWMKRAAEWASKAWLTLTPPERVRLAAVLGTAGKADSAPVRLWDGLIRCQDDPRAEVWMGEFPIASDATAWVMRDGEGRTSAAAAWTGITRAGQRASNTARVQAQVFLAPVDADVLREQVAAIIGAALVVDMVSWLAVGWISRESMAFDAVRGMVAGTPLLADEQEDGLIVDGRAETVQGWLMALVASRREAGPPFLDRTIPESVVRSALRGFHRLSYMNDLARDHQLGMSGKALQDLLLGVMVTADAPPPLTKEHQRLLRLTYVKRPGTADAIASRLSMSRTTYYRQLAEAQTRIVEALALVVGNSPQRWDDRDG